jgi:hypothetical protein
VRRLIVLPLAATAVMLAGCGGGGSNSNGEADRSPAAILADTKQAALDAGSTRVTGTVDESGQTIAFDLKITRHGGGGTLTLHGSKVDIVRLGKTVYIRAPSSFYEKVGAGKAAGQLLNGRWLKAPATMRDFADLASLMDMNVFFTQLWKSEGTVSKGVETTIDGVKTIELKASKGGSLYVAETGKPYLLKVRGGGGSSGTAKLSDWGTATTPAAPKNAIDIGALEK